MSDTPRRNSLLEADLTFEAADAVYIGLVDAVDGGTDHDVRVSWRAYAVPCMNGSSLRYNPAIVLQLCLDTVFNVNACLGEYQAYKAAKLEFRAQGLREPGSEVPAPTLDRLIKKRHVPFGTDAPPPLRRVPNAWPATLWVIEHLEVGAAEAKDRGTAIRSVRAIHPWTSMYASLAAGPGPWKEGSSWLDRAHALAVDERHKGYVWPRRKGRLPTVPDLRANDALYLLLTQFDADTGAISDFVSRVSELTIEQSGNKSRDRYKLSAGDRTARNTALWRRAVDAYELSAVLLPDPDGPTLVPAEFKGSAEERRARARAELLHWMRGPRMGAMLRILAGRRADSWRTIAGTLDGLIERCRAGTIFQP